MGRGYLFILDLFLFEQVWGFSHCFLFYKEEKELTGDLQKERSALRNTSAYFFASCFF